MSGRPIRFSAPVGNFLIVLLLCGACGAAFAIKSVADRAAGDEATVVRALAEVRLQDALEWRAISGADSEDLASQHDASVTEAICLAAAHRAR